jgi:hypothetical protein
MSAQTGVRRMSDDGNAMDRLRHWQIKDFPEAKRLAVIKAAQLAGKTVTDWLEPVIDRALGGDVPAVNRRVYPANGTSAADTLATVAAAIGAVAGTRGVPKATRQAIDATALMVLRDVRLSLGDRSEDQYTKLLGKAE